MKRSGQDQQENQLEVPATIARHWTWLRLEDQLEWYDSKSTRCQWWYKRLKFVQISLAVLIPILSHLGPPYSQWATAFAGALIAILEGVQHMNQYSALWVRYRATAERLSHEKFLFLASAGHYKDQSEREKLVTLAERVEEHVSIEHANWSKATVRVIATEDQEKE